MIKNNAGNLLIACSLGLLIFFAGANACENYPFLAKWVGGKCWFDKTMTIEILPVTAQQRYMEARSLYLEKSDDEVTKAAIYALAQAGTSEAIDALKKLVRTHKSIEIRKAALYALAQCAPSALISSAKLTEFYGDIIANGEALAVRKAAIHELAQANSKEAVVLLENLATSTHHVSLRKAAVHALQNCDSDLAQQALYRILTKVSQSL